MIDYQILLKEKTSWDLIIADPPWGYQNNFGNDPKVSHLLPYPTLSREDYPVMLSNFYTALNANRNCWVWCDAFTLPILINDGISIGFKYEGTCIVKRRSLGLGFFIRKQVYFLICFSKGKRYKNKDATLPEYLGEYQVKRSKKPLDVYKKILSHSLPPNGTWIDPFPPTHIEEYHTTEGIIQKPPLFEGWQ